MRKPGSFGSKSVDPLNYSPGQTHSLTHSLTSLWERLVTLKIQFMPVFFQTGWETGRWVLNIDDIFFHLFSNEQIFQGEIWGGKWFSVLHRTALPVKHPPAQRARNPWQWPWPKNWPSQVLMTSPQTFYTQSKASVCRSQNNQLRINDPQFRV